MTRYNAPQTAKAPLFSTLVTTATVTTMNQTQPQKQDQSQQRQLSSSVASVLRWFSPLYLSGLCLITPLTASADHSAGNHAIPQWQSIPEPTQTPSPQTQPAWLGVGLTTLPTALRAQLAQLIPDQYGVLVNKVTAQSPAAKAGLQVNDIILSFNGTRIQSSNQLARLVQETPPNRTIDLDIVHKGQLVNRTVTLSTRPSQKHNTFSSPLWQALPNLSQQFQQPFQQYGSNNQSSHSSSTWDDFQSVQINALANGRYRAEIHYKDQQQQDKRFTFEGTRAEITQQIQQQNDLPKEKQQALLNAFSMQSNPLTHPLNELSELFENFGSSFSQNNTGQQGLNEPLFQNNPFDHPFFQKDFQKELQNELSPFLNQLKQEFEQFREPSPSTTLPRPAPSSSSNTITL
ncbi:MAG TPA: PDZ domain-containing protein [Thiothrix sp.]|nr:PDZ domain-containing protein [Thiothrix sp.]